MFRLKIALFSTLVSGLVLAGFGWWLLAAMEGMNLEQLDQEIFTLGDAQLHEWRQKEHWAAFDQSLERIYGPRHAGERVVLALDPEKQVLFQSKHWPGGVSMEDFPDFDPKMGPEFLQAVTGKPVPESRPRPRPSIGHPPAKGDARSPRPQALHPPFAGAGNNPPLDVRPEHIKKPYIQTLRINGRTWRMGIMGNPHVTLIIGMDMAAHQARIASFRKILWASSLSALAFLGLGGWLMAHRAIKPVQVITATARTITAGALDRRIPSTGGKNELARLADVINSMLDRLEKSYNQAVRFSADAAHELQTPLTVLQGTLDEAVQHAPEASEEQQRYSSLLEEVRRLKAVVQKLLILARADAGRLALNLSSVNLSVLVESATEDAMAMAEDLAVDAEIQPRIMVKADSDLLRQVLGNLTSNAVKYNVKNGRIRFCLFTRQNRAVLSVSNTGPSLSKQDMEQIFTRFFRADKSRSKKKPGTGLGLSISLEIAKAHNGTLSVSHDPDGLIRFTLILPA